MESPKSPKATHGASIANAVLRAEELSALSRVSLLQTIEFWGKYGGEHNGDEHQWTSDSQFQIPVLDFPGSEAIREAFAIGLRERKLPIERGHRRVLSKHLTSEKPSDLIIYEYALETLRLYLEIASDDVAVQFRTAVARMIVAVAGASGEGFLGSGDKFSDAERTCIEKIAETLDLRSTPAAIQALNEIG